MKQPMPLLVLTTNGCIALESTAQLTLRVHRNVADWRHAAPRLRHHVPGRQCPARPNPRPANADPRPGPNPRPQPPVPIRVELAILIRRLRRKAGREPMGFAALCAATPFRLVDMGPSSVEGLRMKNTTWRVIAQGKTFSQKMPLRLLQVHRCRLSFAVSFVFLLFGSKDTCTPIHQGAQANIRAIGDIKPVCIFLVPIFSPS
jgi:hypothetical protein